jgi:uncharacterized protein (DUF2344 family)
MSTESFFYQLLFEKKKEAVFIPQIYLSYLFFRILRSLGVDFVYTQGFNSKPKARFIYPLSVGIGGEEEHFYFWAYNIPHDLIAISKGKFPEGVNLKSIKKFPEKKVSENMIQAAIFSIELKNPLSEGSIGYPL